MIVLREISKTHYMQVAQDRLIASIVSFGSSAARIKNRTVLQNSRANLSWLKE
jgi:hypothetical protein